MAGCKTMMVRRNSRERLCGSRSSVSGGHTQIQPPHHHHHYRNSSRSKSYHHHHTHQHHYYNQCHYYNTGPNYGYFPQSSAPQQPQSSGLEPHHQQFLGHNDNGFMGSGQLTSRYQQFQQEPPPRPWIQLAHHKHKRTCFTVLCYNILCSRYATQAMYSYCPSWALDWNYRRKAILQELVHYAADIISLQEMETDQYYNFFLPQLQLQGYSGIFAAKSRAKTMVESKRKLVDGCAIFYKTHKFRLLSEHLIEFSQVAISNAARSAQCSAEMLNRVQTKDNIALAALFETKLDSEQAQGLRGLVTPRPQPLLVCTCHMHWDPNYCDVKLVQAMMLMQELKKITEGIDAQETTVSGVPCCRHDHNTRSSSSSSSGSSPSCSFPSGQLNNAPHKVNLLVCGDFNSLPQSGVVEFMQTGTVSSSHPDFKGLKYEGYIDSGRKGEENSTIDSKTETTKGGMLSAPDEFQHDFDLKSTYTPCSMPFTNYTLDFQGVIDYIFHSVKGLRPLGLLGPLDPAWLVQHNVVGAPHPCIPSDHFPLLVELEMIPTV